MTLREAIAKADTIRPNTVPDEQKAAWIYEQEGELAEMMRCDVPENKFPNDDPEQQLLMPYPKDNIYPLYLCAMIDATMEETSLYVNDMILANNAINEARAWWWRNHTPPAAKHFTGI